MMALAVVAAGCDEHGRGGPRDAGLDANTDALKSGRACAFAMPNDPTAVGSPSLDCPSRMCVHINGFTPDLCAADCERVEDCVRAPESPCSAGFACTPVVSTGPFAFRTLCVCADRAPLTP